MMRDLRVLGPLAIGVVLAGIAGCAVENADDGAQDNGSAIGESGPKGPSTEADPEPAGDDAVASAPSSPKWDADFAAASAEFGVPAAVLKAIAWAETRYEMVVGEEELPGKAAAFGVMALSGARLERGAQLAKVSVDDAKKAPRANVRAAAALLSAIADERKIDRATLVAWEPVIGAFTDIDRDDARRELVVDGVYGAMRQGLGDILIPDQSYFGLFVPELTGTPETKAAGPDYGPSIWRGSPNFNSRSGVKPAMVIIHTCEGSYSSCWSWLSNTAASASAHYVVKEDGKEITQLVRESNRAWHVAANYDCKLNGNIDCGRNGTSSNNFTIGIEHGGFASTKTFNPGMIEASAKLVCDITKDHGIARDRFHIVGHGKLQPYNRTDPGPNWPWASYIQRINALCGSGGGSSSSGSTPPPPPPPPSGTALIIDSNNGQNDRARGYIEVGSNWTSSANIAGYYGSGYWWANTAPVSDGATFYFHLAADATKTIDAQWTAATDRAPDAPFVAIDSRGTRVGSAAVNQRANGGKWNTLGTWKFTAGWNKIVLSRWADSGNVVVADAVRVR